MESLQKDNQYFLQGIKQGNDQVLSQIFTQCQSKIKNIIYKLGGNTQEAEDIFMDALEAIYRKVSKEELNIEQCSFFTYLTSVCLNLWYKKFRQQRRKLGVTIESLMVSNESSGIIEYMNDTLKSQLFKRKFTELGEDCQKVLQIALYEEKSIREIAHIMNYTEAFAKKKKFICKERLIEMIKNDPLYPELIQ